MNHYQNSWHYSQWNCHLKSNNISSKKAWDIHIKSNDINDASETFARSMHINKTCKFSRLGLKACSQHIAICMLQTINKRDKHFVKQNKQTRSQRAANETLPITLATVFCNNIVLFVWHLYKAAQVRARISSFSANDCRSDSVFRLWLDRSKLLKLYVAATTMRFFIMNLNSGFHFNDSVITAKKKKLPKR